MKVKMVYKKTVNSGFITIIADFLKEDDNYMYLACGKYIRSNIISWQILTNKDSENKGLVDDA